MSALHTWAAVGAVVVAGTAGDVLIARAMKQVGDVGEVQRNGGLRAVVRSIFGNANFLLGLGAMTLSFFSLLVALSWADLSVVGPATASLTFVTTALASKVFLHEAVDRRRWLAALMVCAGVAVLAS